MTDPIAYKLLAWLSPAMPVGAYSYSHGLEAALAAGLVTDAPNQHAYLATVLRHGSARLDALFLRAAHQAETDGSCEDASLADILATAAAMRATSELALESSAQGRALLTILRRAWPAPALDRLAELCRRHQLEPPYAVVLGVAGAAHQLPLLPTLTAFLHAFAANLISAGLRQIPLGQTDGQQLTATLEPTIHAAAATALTDLLADAATATPAIDLLSIAHETQYTRLFRS
jgi:urease accessory protein